ncbi:MAG: glycine reductase [Deltaproteobacteria bacterium]|nr:glycine reductase [Deltaproteobacteria bacterium]
MASFTPVVNGASSVLIHAPGLVRYGSKPWREIQDRPSRLDELQKSLQSHEQAEAYLPNRVFLGQTPISSLYEVERPWYGRPSPLANDRRAFGDFIDERSFVGLVALADVFKHVSLFEGFWQDISPRLRAVPLFQPLATVSPSLVTRDRLRADIAKGDGIALFTGTDSQPIGWIRHAHHEDGSLTANVLLENLCVKVSAALAVRELLMRHPALSEQKVDYVLSCSEEAVGDRYQRGGGNLAKAVAEFAGCVLASGMDIKNFCAAPIPALVTGAALVHSGVFENVVVVGGASLPKLGMKFLYHLEKGMPVLEDVLAAAAVWIGRDDGKSPVINLASVGRHPVRSGAALDKQLKAIVLEPMERLDLTAASVDRFVTELHNPEITVPANGGDIPERNYKMLAAVLVSGGKMARSEMQDFMKRKGVPGFAPTQGHIASALAYLPHAHRELTEGEARNCFLFARASLFLGQMTQLSDGMSVLLARHP